MSTPKHFIIATAGHVDHGKSALVKALTGTDPDRLPEEKARGITIDLGFAHLELPEAQISAGIVDVPGHEDFVKNMVAGVGSIDLALFVVAADDGWMPQTEEHLQILDYLGVTHAVVALTKIDLATDEAAAERAIREKLADTRFANAPIVPTSTVTQRGINELKNALSSALGQLPLPRDYGKPRLAIDRVFTLHGIGTVVTGTLSGGALQVGQSVVIQPSKKSTRVRNLQSHNHNVALAQPGTRTAINLPDVLVAGKGQGYADSGASRGEVVTLPELGEPSRTVDVLLERSIRTVHIGLTESRPLKGEAFVRVHHGSASHPARVLLLDRSELQPGEKALAQLRFDAPVYVFAGDSFVVRDASEQTTLAGGVVLDPDASRRNVRTPAHLTFLRTRADAPNNLEAFITSALAYKRAVPATQLLLKSHWSATEIAAAMRSRLVGAWAVDPAWWLSLCEKGAQKIKQEHNAHPERPGLALNDLRASVQGELPDPQFFDLLVTDLCRQGHVQVATAIRHRDHRPALPAALQAAGSRIRSALNAKPFEPPARKELAPDAASQNVLRFLIQTGEAIELAEDTVMLAENFARATEQIKNFLRQRGKATASELRQHLNTNRRVIIPLLEKLDKEGVTLRQGDARVLKS
ncbi:MAG TPA: selenocysteine-specific translation elongation factor [Verrucomicrobiae bacterium]|nr:selenocysteine-specific translation elongation factor [Verrucomicrobiae bacterium]